MSQTGITGLLLIALTCLLSYRGFKDPSFLERYSFQVGKVLVNKDYKRLITSGFLHVGWTHLLLNMFTLLFFSGNIENALGLVKFFIVYFAGLVGGNLLSLLVHRHHGDYSAVGASGAISGIIFASIALFPGMSIGFFLIPVAIPAWIYGLLFIIYSIYGIRSGKDNIGHDAHLGGALLGMFTAVLLESSAFAENYRVILLITIPTVIFIWLIISHPGFLLVDNYFFNTHKDFYSIDHKYNAEKKIKQAEIDRILDKINKKGVQSLSSKEKQALQKYARDRQ